MNERSAILLFDGTCGFCARSVQFVLARERRRQTLRFAPLESAIGLEVRARHPELSNVDSVIWFEPAADGKPETVAIRSAAGLRTLRYIGGVWSVLGAIGAVVPVAIGDWVYDLIAKNRHRLLGDDTSCLLPTAEQRARFIDWGG